MTCFTLGKFRLSQDTKNKLLTTRVLSGNKNRSRKQRIIQKQQNELSGENLTLKAQYSHVKDENRRLKDQLDDKDRQLQQTTLNMKDLAAKFSSSGKRNKPVNSQSKSIMDQSSSLRQKNMIIDSLQQQIEGTIIQIIIFRVQTI